MADYERVMERAEQIHRASLWSGWVEVVRNHLPQPSGPVTIGYSDEVQELLDSPRYRARPLHQIGRVVVRRR